MQLDHVQFGGQEDRIHPPIADITDVLSFRVARFNRLIERMGGTNFQSRLGITLNEWRVIGITEALGAATVSQVRKMLVMDKGQMSRIARGLVARGLIVSRPSSGDRRVMALALTEAGRTIHAQVLAEAAHRNERLSGCFSADECSEFLRLLDKLTEHTLKRAEAEGIAP
ncbi:MAG: MarR family winged helix-turn-helix transcriptional regulator [Roseobacter sp.]|nr:MarR family winged helix-turn-helix transcriptional regulator [Roseobacter sp.]